MRAVWGVLGAALLGGVIVLGADDDPVPYQGTQVAAGALPARPADASCEALIRQVPDYWPGGRWRIECVPAMPAGYEGAGGLTYFDSHRILIRSGMSLASTRHAIAHEVAHAESAGFSGATRRAITDAAGAHAWQTAEYFHSPEESYAESRARCAGWHADDWGYGSIPCATIEEALRAEAGRG